MSAKTTRVETEGKNLKHSITLRISELEEEVSSLRKQADEKIQEIRRLRRNISRLDEIILDIKGDIPESKTRRSGKKQKPGTLVKYIMDVLNSSTQETMSAREVGIAAKSLILRDGNYNYADDDTFFGSIGGTLSRLFMQKKVYRAVTKGGINRYYIIKTKSKL